MTYYIRIKGKIMFTVPEGWCVTSLSNGKNGRIFMMKDGRCQWFAGNRSGYSATLAEAATCVSGETKSD